MAKFKPHETQGTHTVHHVQNTVENAVSVRGACSQRVSKATKDIKQAWRNHVERNQE